MNIAYLDITSWVGYSAGAVHYYGKLKGDFLDDWIEMERTLTSEAAGRLTEPGNRYYAKDTTIRFESEEELCDFAIGMTDDLKIDVLYEGSPVYAEPQRIIYTNTGFDIDIANSIYEKFDKLTWPRLGTNDEKEALQVQWLEFTGLSL